MDDMRNMWLVTTQAIWEDIPVGYWVIISSEGELMIINDNETSEGGDLFRSLPKNWCLAPMDYQDSSKYII